MVLNVMFFSQKEELIIKLLDSEDLKLMPYARETVEFFAKREELKLAVCSGSPKNEALIKLRRVKLYLILF